MAIRHQPSHKWWPRTQAPWRPLVATWVIDINTDPGCSKTADSDMDLGSILGPDITLAMGDKQATHISLLLTIFISSVLPWSTAQELFCHFFSYFSTIYLLILMGPTSTEWVYECLQPTRNVVTPGWPEVSFTHLRGMAPAGPVEPSAVPNYLSVFFKGLSPMYYDCHW